MDKYYAKDINYFRDRNGYSSFVQPINKNERKEILKAYIKQKYE